MSVWSVYMLRCADGSLYTGITTDIERRLSEHNSGKGSRYTRARLPVELVFIEPAATESKAKAREAELKSMVKDQKERLAGG